MLYLDTSLLISSVARGSDTSRIQTWLGEQDQLAISGWNIVEFAAGIAQKHRTGDMNGDERADAIAWMRLFITDGAEVLDISARAHRLRGPDALHLAVAEEHGATLCTLDKEQAAAAQAMAMRTMLI